MFEGGAGTDTVYYNESASGTAAGVTVDLAAGTASGGATLSGIENVTGSLYDDALTGDAGRNILIGHYGADVLHGGGGNDVLDGSSDQDTLFGDDGDDVLRGGGGYDQLDGGAGLDTADYSASFEGFVIDLVAGTVNGQARLTNIENVRGGKNNDVITGTAEANILTGSGGFDTMRGDAGNDSIVANGYLYGEAGDDVLYGTAGLLDGGDGTDTADYHLYTQNVYLDLQNGIGTAGSSGSLTLVSIENLVGTNFSFDTLIGDGGGNALYGPSVTISCAAAAVTTCSAVGPGPISSMAAAAPTVPAITTAPPAWPSTSRPAPDRAAKPRATPWSASRTSPAARAATP